jgi:uncharacterized protein (DUF305 family)
MMKISSVMLTVLMMVSSSSVFAQQAHNHADHSSASDTASTVAYKDGMAIMMRDMMVPPTGIPDVDFAKGMIPHHEGAVIMAKVQKQFGKDPAMLKLADEIIAAQDPEIVFMKAWLAKQDVNALEKVPASITAGEAAMDGMMQAMATPYTGNSDVDFAVGMIPHHQGAIDMAKVVLQFGKDAEIRALAENVIKTQEVEIKILKDWLAKNGG